MPPKNIYNTRSKAAPTSARSPASRGSAPVPPTSSAEVTVTVDPVTESVLIPDSAKRQRVRFQDPPNAPGQVSILSPPSAQDSMEIDMDPKGPLGPRKDPGPFATTSRPTTTTQ